MFIGASLFVIGGAMVLAPAVHAEDTTAKQQEVSTEAAKKAAEEVAEAKKQEAEWIYEKQKDASEGVREAVKKDAEEEREGLQDALELEKKMKNASSTDDEDEKSEKDKKGEDELYLSAVARFIRSLDRIASSSPGGIGEQVREIAHEQGSTTRATAEHIEKVLSRSAFMSFLIGVDRERVSELERSVGTMQDSIDRLAKVQANATSDIALEIGEEVKALAKEKERVQAIIDANKEKVGIFGWFIKLLK